MTLRSTRPLPSSWSMASWRTHFNDWSIESASVQRWLCYSFTAAFAGLGAKLAASERDAYLLHDFHRLSLLSENTAANTWSAAMRISISIYLDIINLFLQLLDLLGN